jgi:NADPH:quinone reductase-like Zn-dependent oxidoreductase
VFIYGGSTAMGVSGIQYAKLSGATVITTSSPRNFDYVKSLGADVVFDYSSPTAIEDIKAFANNNIRLAWDCISSAESAKFTAQVLSPEGGRYSHLVPVPDEVVKEINPKIETGITVYYTVFGEPWAFGAKQEAIPADYEFGKMFWELSRDLLVQGKIKPIKVDVNRAGSGLEGVLQGMNLLKEGKVSASKLVYTL